MNQPKVSDVKVIPPESKKAIFEISLLKNKILYILVVLVIFAFIITISAYKKSKHSTSKCKNSKT